MQGFRIALLAIFVTVVLGTWYGVVRVAVLDLNADVGESPWLYPSTHGTWHALNLGLSRSLVLAPLLAIVLVAVARFGPWPKLGARDLHRPILAIVLVAIVGGVAAGIAGMMLNARHVWLTGINTARLPEETRGWLLADLWFREGFLLAGGFGLILFFQAALSRRHQLARIGDGGEATGAAVSRYQSWNSLRFSMRTFLLLMLSAAVVFGVAGRRVQHASARQRLLADIRDRGVQLQVRHGSRVDSRMGEQIGYAYMPAVSLRMDRNVDYDDVLRTLADAPTVLELDVVQDSLDERFWTELFRHTEIESVRLVSASVSDEKVKQICRLPNIARLSLDGCPVTDAIVPDVIQHGDWVALSFRATLLSRDALDQMRTVTWPDRFVGWPVAMSEHQREFGRILGAGATVNSGPNGGEFHVSLTGDDVDIADLASLPLESIRIRERALSDTELQLFGGSRRLKSLVLRGGVVNESQLPLLAKIPHLTRLDLSGNECTGEAFNSFASLSQLRVLQINECPLTRAGFEQLLKLTQLEELGLANCGLRDDDLRRLAVFEKLTVLALGGRQITDAAVDHLERISTLERLVLWPTSISDSRLDAWKKTKPELLIVQRR